MRLERRFYTPLRGPKDSMLILTPDNDAEVALLDHFFGDDLAAFDNQVVSLTLCTDDMFVPYMKILRPV
jgi:hypothetical protein